MAKVLQTKFHKIEGSKMQGLYKVTFAVATAERPLT